MSYKPPLPRPLSAGGREGRINFGGAVPRALPWAIIFPPYGALEFGPNWMNALWSGLNWRFDILDFGGRGLRGRCGCLGVAGSDPFPRRKSERRLGALPNHGEHGGLLPLILWAIGTEVASSGGQQRWREGNR